MANSIEFAKNYTGILDEVYQRAAVSRCLNSGGRMVRAGRNAKEILIPKISVTGLGDYMRNVGYKTGSITYEYETHSFGYDRAIRLFADVMDVEEIGVLDCFVEAGAELQRAQVAPEGDAYTISQIASTEGVTVKGEDLSEASAVDVLAALRAVTNVMDERQVSTGSLPKPWKAPFYSGSSRILFTHLFKIIRRMLADRANKILRQFLSDILVAANHAAPNRLTFLRFSHFFRLRLDVVLIVRVGRRRLIR